MLKMTSGLGIVGMGMALLSAQAMAAPPGFYISAGVGQAEQHVQRDSSSGLINLTTPIFVLPPPTTPPAGGTELRTSLTVDGKAFGWDLTFGYRLNDYVAAELAYMDFGRAQIEQNLTSILVLQPLPPDAPPAAVRRSSGDFTAVGDVNVILPARFHSDIRGPALSVLGSLPLAERWSVYLRAGVIFTQQDVAPTGRTLARGVSFHDEVLFGGVGGTYDLSSRLMLRAEYQRSDDIGSREFGATTHLEQFQLSIAYQL